MTIKYTINLAANRRSIAADQAPLSEAIFAFEEGTASRRVAGGAGYPESGTGSARAGDTAWHGGKVLRANLGIAAKPAWQELLREDGGGREFRLRDELVAAASAGDADELIALCRGGTKAVYAALGLLLQLARFGSARLPADRQEEWLGIVRSLARSEFPETRIGRRSFQAWRERDSAGAQAFLLGEVDMSRPLDEAATSAIVMDLWSFGSAEAITLLEQMSGLSGRAASLRDSALEDLLGPTPERITRLAEEWRTTRSAAALQSIYGKYISGLPEGSVPVRRLEDLLGPSHSSPRPEHLVRGRPGGVGLPGGGLEGAAQGSAPCVGVERYFPGLLFTDALRMGPKRRQVWKALKKAHNDGTVAVDMDLLSLPEASWPTGSP